MGRTINEAFLHLNSGVTQYVSFGGAAENRTKDSRAIANND